MKCAITYVYIIICVSMRERESNSWQPMSARERAWRVLGAGSHQCNVRRWCRHVTFSVRTRLVNFVFGTSVYPYHDPPKLSGKGLIKLLFIIFITFTYFFSLQTSKSTKLFHNLILFFLYLCFTVNFFN